MIATSAKTRRGISDVLDAVISRIRPPLSPENFQDTRGLIVDAWFDPYRGAVCLVRVDNGSFANGDRIGVFHSRSNYIVQEVGIVTPTPIETGKLQTGQIGYLIAGVKTLRHLRLGDTVFTLSNVPAKVAVGDAPASLFAGIKPLPGTSGIFSTCERVVVNEFIM